MARNARERSVLSEAVADEIRGERARTRMLQVDVAEAASMSLATYIRIEQGARVVDVSQLARLAEAFGVSASEILAHAEARVAAAGSDPVAPQSVKKSGVAARVGKRKPSAVDSQITESSRR